MDKILNLFKRWDINGDGQIDLEEFSTGMQLLKLNVTEEEIDKLFTIFDRDGSGEIDYNELCKALRKNDVRCIVAFGCGLGSTAIH